MTGKTLKELNVQPGDVVELTKDFFGHGGEGSMYLCREDGELQDTIHGGTRGNNFITGHDSDVMHEFRIISRASDIPKLWRDMTPEEKGALLLAHHEGKVIEVQKTTGSIWYTAIKPIWHSDYAHRVRPEPKVETVTLYGGDQPSWVNYIRDGDSHRITFNLIDGKPDCSSVKMEKL